MNTLLKQWGWIFVIAAIALGAIAFRQRDEKLKERAAALARAEIDKAKITALADSLGYTRMALAVASSTAREWFASYDSLRSNPLVRRVVLPGETDTVTVVRTEFVTVADSLRQACGILEAECARYRVFADSAMAAQARVIRQLEIADKNKGGFSLKVRPGLFGGKCFSGEWCGGGGVVLTF